jgi:DNA-binding NarL/FixJ family response regulator
VTPNHAATATVLVADDNPRMIGTLVEMLQGGYRVLSAPDGNSAIREALAFCPDVVVLDMDLGDTTGLEVTKRLRLAGSSAKIIFLTIYEDIEFIRAAEAVGASGYIFKSRTGQDLVLAIEAVMQGKRFVSTLS